MIFSMLSNCGFQPSTVRAFSEDAINVSGSPGRRSAFSAGISLPVTLRAASRIWRFENPVEDPRLKAVDSLPLRRYSTAKRWASAKSNGCT